MEEKEGRMKTTVVIPTYWGREGKIGYKEGDAIYDHPTPLDEEGTLKRVIESTRILHPKDFELVIVGVATTPDIEPEVEEKIKDIVQDTKTQVPVFVFSYSELKNLVGFLNSSGKTEFADLLQLKGYSNVRNLCLMIPQLLGSETVILIDDDETFEDPDFIKKAREFLKEEFDGEKVYAKAGYYLTPQGGYIVKMEIQPWMTYWNKIGWMNLAFEKLIGTQPRLKKTPFVFGGNMVICKEIFTKVPFDPGITRGEDIDYLMNAEMFGYDFYLDNQLSIKHDPPTKPHPEWRKLREDIYRFVFTRKKLRLHKPHSGMRKVDPEMFDPYPGNFLKDDLDELIFRSNLMLGTKCLAAGDLTGYKECMRNIYLSQTDAVPKFDPFERLVDLQKRWEELMEFLGNETVKSQILKKISFSE
jgi:glycosyltransferase involved in cell wall biosynthesis